MLELKMGKSKIIVFLKWKTFPEYYFISVSKRAVIGQFSVLYSTVRLAKI